MLKNEGEKKMRKKIEIRAKTREKIKEGHAMDSN